MPSSVRLGLQCSVARSDSRVGPAFVKASKPKAVMLARVRGIVTQNLSIGSGVIGVVKRVQFFQVASEQRAKLQPRTPP